MVYFDSHCAHAAAVDKPLAHPASRTMTPGSRFGHYEIRRELGRGAMGVVYEAFDTLTHRAIALKVLQGAGVDAGDTLTAAVADELRERFRREGQVAGQLVHPNIVAVYDARDRMPLAGADAGRDGPPYLVMEFIDGGDLKTRLASRVRFTPVQVAQVMGQLLGALHYAHQRGVIHRDVKPANVLMRSNGRLKLTDFGIAHIAGSDLTRTGEVMGTLAYMSPEQITGAGVDARADLYACGVILYELLTGEAPFAGAATTIMQKILNQEPLPPSKLNPALPRALDDVLRRALAKRPDARYADAPAFERALADALFDEDDEATPRRPDVATASLATANIDAEADADAAAAPDAPPSKAGFVLAAVVAAGALVAIAIGMSPPRFGTLDSENQRIAIAPSLTVAPRPIAAAEAPVLPPPRSGDASLAAGLHTPQEIERMAWDHARAADNAVAYRAYIAAYPDGAYLKLAQVHLAVLAQRAHLSASPGRGPGDSP